jgi:type I restriction enzyme S subunit
MQIKSYPKYKDSGIQWIGEIPEGWKINKVKHNVYSLKKTGLEASEGNEEGKYPFFTSSQIQNKFIGKAVFNSECLILGTGGFASIHYCNGGFSASNDCMVLKKQNNINLTVLYYQILDNLQIIDDLGFWGMGLRHLQKYFFYNLFVCWPRKEEQIKVADFLDKKTAEIGELMEKDKKLIELLKEKRIALINHAVTKGLPVLCTQTGLDPNAKMKDSGIEWIGKIPEGWEVYKLKYKTIINKKKLEDDINPNYIINYLDISNVDSSGNILEIEEYIFEDAPSRARRIPRSGDTILSTVRTYLKAVAYLENIPGNLIVSTGFAVLEPIKSINSKYLFYSTISEVFIQNVIAYSKGVAYPAINPPELGQIPIIIPPLIEQTTIANFLDKATAKIDKTIQKIQKKIKLLEEYKKSLIHHTVTGKIDVREV